MSYWANKLNNQPVSQPSVMSRDLYPTTPVYTTPQVQAPAVSEEYVPSVRLIEGSVCPGCGSDSYRGAIGSRAVSCPTCGYHPRFEQSGYGTPSLPGSKGDATPARQIDAAGTSIKASIAILNAGGGDHIR
jgi:hypothetical protein